MLATTALVLCCLALPAAAASQAPIYAAVMGYASEVSVLQGGTLDLHVSANEPYHIMVAHIGPSYTVECLPSCQTYENGTVYPMPAPDPTTGEVDAGWPVTDSVPIPASWPSGFYEAEFIGANGAEDWVPFVVRSSVISTSSPRPALVVLPANTWQAYNNWGGKSLYSYNSTDNQAATTVSFDRPYEPMTSLVLGEPLVWFLEHQRYALDYATDVDVQQDPALLLQYRLVIVDGHSEYWTKEMRDAYEAARDAGVNLMFLGADIGYWQIRYGANERSIIEYRDANLDPETDPALKTVAFRLLTDPAGGRPECTLEGVQFQTGLASPADYGVVPSSVSDPWFAGTGLSADTPLRGLVSGEWDAIQPGCETPPLTPLFHYDGPSPADAVRYTAPSGAIVFSAGSLGFVEGLDPYDYAGLADPRLMRFMENALAATGAETRPLNAPTIIASDPASPASDDQPDLIGTAEFGSTINLYTTSDCSGAPVAQGPVSTFTSPGIQVPAADEGTATFRATATDGTGNTSPCSAGFTYVETSRILVVRPSGSGDGAVSSLPVGIDCGVTCTHAFANGASVTLTATPAPGSIFAGWSGACSGRGACTVTLSSDRTVTATFVRAWGLKVSKRGSAGGRVASSPAGIACGSTCAGVFPDGSLVVLSAKPRPGVGFAGWSGACSGTGHCRLTMSGSQAVVAKFVRLCTVPKLKGKTLRAAERALRERSCRVGTIKAAFSGVVEKGHVISQSRMPGTHLKKGAKVKLTVSQGKR